MSVKRKILLITGSRAEYGLSYPILKAIEKHPGLDLQLIVVGMHLLPRCGNTIDIIRRDGFLIAATIKTLNQGRATGAEMANSIGRCVLGLTKEVLRLKPDFLIAMTDLGFTLATAIVGAHMNIPVAHVHGGDVSGSVDDSVRHATTKLSHLHFVVSKQSAERIIKMGEEPWRVHVVGAPGLDMILREKLWNRKKTTLKFGLYDKKPYIVFLQHPVTSEAAQAGWQYQQTLNALEYFKLPTILIYPNTDAGSDEIVSIIKINQYQPYLHIVKNLSRAEYLSLLKYAAVLVGNSSSGIIEGPSFHLPVVNIGTRQHGRERAENIIDVTYSTRQIIRAISNALSDASFKRKVKLCRNPYGQGRAGETVAKILYKTAINAKLIQKIITY